MKRGSSAEDEEEGRRVIGRWQIHRTLGVGNFAKVKLGIDVDTGAPVALKILDHGDPRANERWWRYLEREIDAMSRVASSEHCLRLIHHDLNARYPKKDGSERECALLVLEFAQGGEMFDFLSLTGPFPEAIARTYFRQLLSAMQACHSRGVYHRDLKPENILLDASFQLKVADFGLSACLDESKGFDDDGDERDTEEMKDGDDDYNPSGHCVRRMDEGRLLGSRVGSSSYMAPEIIQQRPYLGAPADIWSAGVVLFIMLLGRVPFSMAVSQDWHFRRLECGDNAGFWHAHLRECGTAAAGRGLSTAVRTLLDAIFEPLPERRASLDELLHHPWLTEGERIPDSALKEHLRARAAEIRLRKRAEREQQAARQREYAERQRAMKRKAQEARIKRMRAGGAGGGDALFDPHNRDTANRCTPVAFAGDGDGTETRAMELENEESPTFRRDSVGTDEEVPSLKTESSNASSASSNPSNTYEGGKVRAPALPCGDGAVNLGLNSAAHFYTCMGAGGLLHRIADALASGLMATKVVARRARCKVTASVTVPPGGTVELEVRVFRCGSFDGGAPTEGGDNRNTEADEPPVATDRRREWHFVQVSRRRGDVLQFQRVCETLLGILDDVVDDTVNGNLDGGEEVEAVPAGGDLGLNIPPTDGSGASTAGGLDWDAAETPTSSGAMRRQLLEAKRLDHRLNEAASRLRLEPLETPSSVSNGQEQAGNDRPVPDKNELRQGANLPAGVCVDCSVVVEDNMQVRVNLSTDQEAAVLRDAGSQLLSRDEAGRAALAFAAACKRRPTSAGAQVALGKALASDGQLSSAEAAYRRALELNERCPAAYLGLGLVLKARGDIDESLAVYSAGLSKESVDAGTAVSPRTTCSLHMSRGLALAAKSDPTAAVQAFRDAIAAAELGGISPVESHFSLAVLYARQGEVDLALQQLELAVHAGLEDSDWLAADDDLAELRNDARFTDLLKRVSDNYDRRLKTENTAAAVEQQRAQKRPKSPWGPNGSFHI